MLTARSAVARRDGTIDRRRTRCCVGIGGAYIAAGIGRPRIAAGIRGPLGPRVGQSVVTRHICAISTRIGAAVLDRGIERAVLGNVEIAPDLVSRRRFVVSVTKRPRVVLRRGTIRILERGEHCATPPKERRRKDEEKTREPPHCAHGS
jgi:hypothetical protein